MLTDADVQRVYRLPTQVGRTLDKLERLLAKAEELGLPPDADWRWRFEYLNSRYLTDARLIDDAWEREVKRSRKLGEHR